ARKITIRDSGCHFGDVSHLARQVGGHEVDVVSKVLAGTGHAGHVVPAGHVRATAGTFAWPPSFPSVPTSRATRVTSLANAFSWSTMVLMVSLSSRISPRTSTVIFLERSPLAIAVETSAMLRTWAVRFDAIELTLSVKSFQVPATPSTLAWPPSRPSVPTSRATRVTSPAKALS